MKARKRKLAVLTSTAPDGATCGVIDFIGEGKIIKRLQRFGKVEALGETTAAGDPVHRLHVSHLWHFFSVEQALTLGGGALI